MDWFKKRFKEGSTWAGLGAVITGFGMLFKANGMPEAGQAIAQGADALAGGNYAAPLATALTGIVAAIMPDKGHD